MKVRGLGMLQFTEQLGCSAKSFSQEHRLIICQIWDAVINGVDKRGLLNFLKHSYHFRSFEIHKGVQTDHCLKNVSEFSTQGTKP